ncbi:MAG: hypothetical protein ACO1SV_09075 [Fimbriimonas sp.]
MASSIPPSKLSDGRVSIGKRALTDAEREELRRRDARHRGAKIFWGIAIAIIPFYCAGVVAYLPTGDSPVAMGMLFGSIVLVGVLVAQAKEVFGRRSGAVSTATEVERFQDPVGGQVTEVIVGAGEVHSRDGQPVTKAETVEVFVPAAAPASVAARGGERRLSGEEAKELAEIIRAAKRKVRNEIPLPLFVLVLMTNRIVSFPNDNGLSFLAWGLGALMIFSVFNSLKSLFSARQMQKDAAEGTVEGGDDRELLPHSRLAWTVKGEPASWRSLHMPKG